MVALILFSAAFTYLVSLSAGRLLMRGLRINLYQGEERFLSFVLGAAALSNLVFLLTVAGLAYKSVFLAAGTLILALGFRRRVHVMDAKPLPALSRNWRIAFWTVFTVYGLLYLSNAMAPETSPDGVWYHIPLIARYLREHHLPRITTDMYAYLSEGIEMLFLFAFAFGKHSAAAMVEFLFLLVTPLGMLAYARRAGNPAGGVAGALLFYAAPLVGRTGTIAYVDVATAGVVFALFYTLQIWRETRDHRMLVLIGIFAGFGYAAKYTAFVGVPYALAFVAFYTWRSGKRVWRPALTVALCSLILIAPWVVKNIVFVSNPFAPFFNSWFPNPYEDPAFEKSYKETLRHFNGVRLPQAPIEVTVGGDLQGITGPVFLLSPLALLALRTAAGRQLLIAMLVFLVPYFENIGARFLIPSLTFLSLALAFAATRIRGVAPVLLAFHVISSWPAAVNTYVHKHAWRMEGSQWRAALRLIPGDSYLRSRLDHYDMALLVDRYVPPDGVILTGTFSNRSYHSRDVIIPFGTPLGERLYDMLRRVVRPEMRPTRRYAFRFTPQELRGVRVVQTKPSHEMWSISELNVFHSGRRIPRGAGWRLRASADPWQVQFAFDNSPVTMWRAHQPWKSSIFVQVDFGGAQIVDSVAVDAPQDQDDLALALEGQVAPGRWQRLRADLTQRKIPYPPGMRRAAAEEMKMSGVDWIVVRDDEVFAQDFIEHSGQWGITQVAESNRYRLWRVD